jgi:endonuclease YncB( thermonuclease family)
MFTPPKTRSWQGRAVIIENSDGDTLKAQIDLGFSITLTTKLRVAGVQAPEMASPRGAAARLFLFELVPPGSIVNVSSKRLDKYGRAEATLLLLDGRDVATLIIESGHGIPADDRTKAPT